LLSVVALLVTYGFPTSAILSIVFLLVFVIDGPPFSTQHYFCNYKRHSIVFLF
jgi:hypothetical protein